MRRLVLVLLLSSVLALPAAAEEVLSPRLQTLLERLLAPVVGAFNPSEPEKLDLLVGRLPERLPTEVPLPEGARVLGSVGLAQARYEILLDADQSPEQVREFYQQTLAAAGWTLLPRPHSGAFLAQNFLPPLAFRCCENLLLLVNAQARKDGPTDVRLTLINSSRRTAHPQANFGTLSGGFGFGVMSGEPGRSPNSSPISSPIPVLTPPARGQVSGPTISRPTNGGWSSFSALTTGLSAQALLAHYAGQLEGAGWVRASQGTNGPLAWSTWTRSQAQERWSGFLSVTEWPGQADRRQMQFQVEPLK